jgi:hypothetical protein
MDKSAPICQTFISYKRCAAASRPLFVSASCAAGWRCRRALTGRRRTGHAQALASQRSDRHCACLRPWRLVTPFLSARKAFPAPGGRGADLPSSLATPFRAVRPGDSQQGNAELPWRHLDAR